MRSCIGEKGCSGAAAETEGRHIVRLLSAREFVHRLAAVIDVGHGQYVVALGDLANPAAERSKVQVARAAINGRHNTTSSIQRA